MSAGIVPAMQRLSARVIDPGREACADVVERMRPHLSPEQARLLADTLGDVFSPGDSTRGNEDVARQFLEAKALENLSARTIGFYRSEIGHFLAFADKSLRHVTAADVRSYLASQPETCGPVTLDNKRRILRSFFQWMEDEDIIRKSPVKKVGKIKCEKRAKAPYTDAELAAMQAALATPRDHAIFFLLLSSGMRVSEMCGLDRAGVDLDGRTCEVLGKGNKRRRCYFDANAAMWLRRYLDQRSDGNPALFVSQSRRGGEFQRLGTGAVEVFVRNLGRRVGVQAYPHKFRRTFATNAIRRGVPIEQVQKLLGHAEITTTTIYAIVSDEDVRHTALRLLG